MAQGMRSSPYSREILRLAAGVPDLPPLDAPDSIVELRSESCGSRLRLELMLDGDRVGKVRSDISACAYGQAATVLMMDGAIGMARGDIEHALVVIEDWLRGANAVLPDWPGIEALAPARERPGRHGAVLLPFRALARAMEEAR